MKNNNVSRNNNRKNNNSRNNNSSKSGTTSGWIIVVVVLIALVGIYFYIQQSNYSEGFTSDNKLTVHEEKSMNCVLFHAPWCGHCKTFKPEWEKIKNELNNTTINNVKVKMIDVNCDEEPDLAKAYNVQGFPTVKCISKGNVVDYDGERSYAGVKEYVNEKANNL